MLLLHRKLRRRAHRASPMLASPAADLSHTPRKGGEREAWAELAERGERGRGADVSMLRRWVGVGETVEAPGGYRLAGGLLYVRRAGPGLVTADDEPSTIDLGAPVSPKFADHAGRTLSYWPSYAGLTPQARAAYLEWLVQGRSRKATPIGYVFLFFYGLERRILQDAMAGRVAVAEVRTIYREIVRLRQRYPHPSFVMYSGRLLEMILCRFTPKQRFAPGKAPARDAAWRLRLGLGQMALHQMALPTAWALAWLRQNGLRTGAAAKKLPEDFEALFGEMYADEFGEGLVLKDRARCPRLRYQPATANISLQALVQTMRVCGSQGRSLPDVTAMMDVVAALEDLGDRACKRMSAFGRVVHDAEAPVESLRQLSVAPGVIAERHMSRAQKAWVARVRTEASEGVCFFAVSEMLALFAAKAADKFSAQDRRQMRDALDCLGLVMVPDPELGFKLDRDSVVGAFRPVRATAAWSTAEAQAALATLVGAAVMLGAEPVADEVSTCVLNGVIDAMGVRGGLRESLALYARWLAHAQSPEAAFRKLVRTLPGVSREKIAAALAPVVFADGRESAKRLGALQTRYAQLGLDPAKAIAGAHESALAGPVTVREGSGAEAGFSLPAAPSSAPVRPRIDFSLLEKKRKDTSRVAGLLHDIFAEEDAVHDGASDEADAASPRCGEVRDLPGLDAAHAALVRALAAAPRWDREAFDALAAAQQLMPQGAVDAINEAVLDACDAPLIEDNGDGYDIDLDVFEEYSQ